MKPTVYLETTIVSYLPARLSRDLLVAARQQITRDWWATSAARFDLCASEAVWQEATRGDAEMVARRLEALQSVRILPTIPASMDLARVLIAKRAIPKNAATDAVHIAIAATGAMDYLLTWNCAHINNAQRIRAIELICSGQGWPCPRVCSPEQLP